MTDFGGRLRRAREQRGISLRQIAARTKISTAALEALERNDVSRLPGGIFSRAFVRSYAIEVGLDPEVTLREFVEQFAAEPPSVAPVVVPGDVSAFESQQQMAGALLTLVLISLVLVGVILYFTTRDREPAVSADGPRPVASEPDPPAAVAAQPELASITSEKAARPEAAGFRLELHPSGPCWISLTVDGELVMARLLEAGERLTYTVERVAAIEVGDAGVFEYTLNGRPGRPLGGAGQVRRARITPATLDEYFR